MRYKEFSFVVEEMTDEQAEQLLEEIIDFVEKHGLSMGGGYRPTTDADYEEASDA